MTRRPSRDGRRGNGKQRIGDIQHVHTAQRDTHQAALDNLRFSKGNDVKRDVGITGDG